MLLVIQANMALDMQSLILNLYCGPCGLHHRDVYLFLQPVLKMRWVLELGLTKTRSLN